MKTKGAMALLAVIAVGVVIAAMLVTHWADQRGGESAARQAARETAHTEAGYYCTLGGVVPGMTGLDDPKYLHCVKRQTADAMETWDREHPGD